MERAVLQPRHPDSVPFYQHQGFHRLALSLLAVPGEARHCWWRCRSRVALGQIERARVETLAELGSHPDNGYAWLSWAWLCTHREGLSQEALKAFQAARRWIPHSLEVKEQLCIALTLHGDDRALGDAQAFLEEYETDPRHRAFCLAFFHARQGRWEEVLANASRSHPGPDHLEFLELMAEASLQTGRLDQGYRLLNRFCALASLSGYPMLQRPQRLERARRRLRSLRSPAQGSGRGAL